jgi:hypothetical protein
MEGTRWCKPPSPYWSHVLTLDGAAGETFLTSKVGARPAGKKVLSAREAFLDKDVLVEGDA